MSALLGMDYSDPYFVHTNASAADADSTAGFMSVPVTSQ